MEHCQGGTLESFLKENGPLGENIIRFFSAEILLALVYLHEVAGIIHR